MNITDALIDCLDQSASVKPSPETWHQVKRCLLDYTCVAYAGRKVLGGRLDVLDGPAHDGPCALIGGGRSLDLYTAAMMNGVAAHVIELDDGHRVGAPHLEAVIISAMLALAQAERLTAEQFCLGVLMGYEADIRLSSAIQPGHKLRGFHSTGTCGAVGVACAAAYALGFTRAQKKAAISAAASGGAGILEVLDDNSELKPYNVANAILTGITAAYFARAGFQGPEDVLGGHRGFFRAHTDEVKTDRLLGQRPRPGIFEIYVKPFASCRHSHPAVECALALRGRRAFSAEDVRGIEIRTYQLAIYGHDTVDVTGVSAAKMSTPYSVAAALVTGGCGMEAFSPETIAREDVRALARKITVTEDPRLTAACPEKRGAVVTVRLADGTELTEEVEYPLGEPENPVTDSQLESKFDSLMDYAGVAPDEAARIKARIWDIERQFGAYLAGL